MTASDPIVEAKARLIAAQQSGDVKATRDAVRECADLGATWDEIALALGLPGEIHIERIFRRRAHV